MSKFVNLGVFSTDIAKLVRQLRSDMRDDWYPDALGYADALHTDVATELLESRLAKGDGLFMPDGRTELNIPKKGFVLRYSLEMSLPDRLYYQALVGELIPFFDPLIPNQVLNHRYTTTEQRARDCVFKHPIEQWKLFNGYVTKESHSKPGDSYYGPSKLLRKYYYRAYYCSTDRKHFSC